MKKGQRKKVAPVKKPQLTKQEDNIPSSGHKPRFALLSKSRLLRFSVLGVALLVFTNWQTNPSILVDTADRDPIKSWNVPCFVEDYEPEVAGCTPKKCKRFVLNNFTTLDQVTKLINFASTAMQFGGGSGGPTIFDVSSGALSKGEAFIDLYKVLRLDKALVLKKSDFDLVTNITLKIKKILAKEYSLTSSLYLTKPMFFSRMYGISEVEAKTFHDEYWHEHVDKEAYGTFVYTCLLYLSDYGSDFSGGEFVFDDKGRNHTVHPAKGRLSCFTSGRENPHHVAKVQTGTRWALTIAFTCDSKSKVPNFVTVNKDLMIETE